MTNKYRIATTVSDNELEKVIRISQKKVVIIF